MKRREFIKSVVGGGLVAGSTLGTGVLNTVFAAQEMIVKPHYDLVAVRGGEPDLMLDRAMASLGGMQNFVARGSKVLVKPNIGWDVAPEQAGNTNPRLVGRIVEHCLEAGAKQVSVFDHTCDPWGQCYRNSGIEKAVKDAGGRIVSGDNEGYYQTVTIDGAQRLTKTKVHELLLDADVFINVPVLKHHSSSQVTVGMKNLMGVVWDRWYWHRNDLHQCIADFASYRKPDLTIVDAYRVMKQNGPRGISVKDVVPMKSLLVSTDPVAVDAAAAMMFGHDPHDIRHIELAANMNIGQIDLKKLNINRIKI